MSDLSYSIEFVSPINGAVSTKEGVCAAVAAAALHRFGLFSEDEIETLTTNGSTVEHEFDGYTIRVRRA